MRALGYLFLLILALYFMLLKPYLLAKRVDWDIEGLEVSFEKGIIVRAFFLHIPTRDFTINLLLRGVSIKPWQLHAEELNLIDVTKKPREKAFDYDFTDLTRLASRLNLSLGRIYLSMNSPSHLESLTLFIPKIQLRDGRFFSDWTRVYWMHGEGLHYVEVFPSEVYISGDSLVVKRAEVKSYMYEFELKGLWRGKRGSFEAYGKLLPLEGKNYHVGETTFRAEGALGYTNLRTLFWGELQHLDLKGRRVYKDLKVEGEYLWEWREKSQVKAKVYSHQTLLNINYSIKDQLLRGSFEGFVVDEKLLGLTQRVFSVTSGNIALETKKKTLKLQVMAPNLQIGHQSLMGAELRLELDYSQTPRGNFEFISLQPFYLSFRGSFLGKNLSGDVDLMGYSLRKENLSLQLSYKGTVSLHEGILRASGAGSLWGVTYRDLDIGSAGYRLSMEGDAYQIRISGEAFSLVGGGSLKEDSFSGSLSLLGMNLFYGGISVKSLSGEIGLRREKGAVHALGSLSALLSKEELSSGVKVGFDIKGREGVWHGSFGGNLVETKFLGIVYREGKFEGRLEGELVRASFSFGEYLRGSGYYSLEKGSYILEGSVKHGIRDFSVDADYSIKGVGRNLEVLLRGAGKYKTYAFPLMARLSMKENRLDGMVEGFTAKDGLLTFSVDGIRFYGSKEEGSIDAGPVLISLGQETLSRIDFSRGSYRSSNLYLKGKLSGVLEGSLDVRYEGGLGLQSEGFLDLGRLFTLVKSRVLADVDGKVFYRLMYGGDAMVLSAKSEKVSLRSRYLAMPLQGALDFSFRDNKLSGSLNFHGNQRTFVNADFKGDRKSVRVSFEASQLPILYRGESLRASLLLSGKGNILSDYKNLRIDGKLLTSGFLNLQKLTRRQGTPSEEYKRVSLDISLLSSEPLRVNLPEGFIYTDVSASIGGTLYEPKYRLNTYFKGGTLRYFERNFYIRRGEASFTERDSSLDLTITTPTPEYTIIIDLKGNPQYPKAIVRSEPPRDTREVLTTLLFGGADTEGAIPLAGAVISQIPQVSGIIKGAKGLTGLDVKFHGSPSISPTGEVGLNAVISKDITERISLEHRQSTLRNPKETYTGGEARLTQNTSVGGRLYSDKTQEVRLRLRKKFDF
ncbi:MAG: translocation/assembly module TamB [Aquificaceae bacterium]|nr:translocation/assembly module TamB [Aquificaceae bacterium]